MAIWNHVIFSKFASHISIRIKASPVVQNKQNMCQTINSYQEIVKVNNLILKKFLI